MTTTQSPTPTASGLELPELPEGAYTFGAAWSGKPAFTADQMHTYARQALAAQPAPGVGGVSELLEQLRGELAEDKGWDYTEYERGRLAEKERVISQLAALTTRPAESVAQGGEWQVLSTTERLHEIERLWSGIPIEEVEQARDAWCSPTPATGSGGEAKFWITRADLLWADNEGGNVIACPAIGDAPDDAILLYTRPAPAGGDAGDSLSLHSIAEKLYVAHTKNHPQIRCNRFPAWRELSNEAKREWLNTAAARKKWYDEGTPVDESKVANQAAKPGAEGL